MACICSSSVPLPTCTFMRSIHEKSQVILRLRERVLRLLWNHGFFTLWSHEKESTVGIVRYMYLSCTGARKTKAFARDAVILDLQQRQLAADPSHPLSYTVRPHTHTHFLSLPRYLTHHSALSHQASLFHPQQPVSVVPLPAPPPSSSPVQLPSPSSW